jgi:hypothetical protein
MFRCARGAQASERNVIRVESEPVFCHEGILEAAGQLRIELYDLTAGSAYEVAVRVGGIAYCVTVEPSAGGEEIYQPGLLKHIECAVNGGQIEAGQARTGAPIDLLHRGVALYMGDSLQDHRALRRDPVAPASQFSGQTFPAGHRRAFADAKICI